MSYWKVEAIKPGLFRRWQWSIYHSGYGMQMGAALTLRRAKRQAKIAISDFVMGA